MSAPSIVMPLFAKRSIPLPTWRGWVLLITILVILMCAFSSTLYTSLAVTDPTGGGLLIIEGWVPDHVVKSGIDLFRSGRYQHIVTTGVPIDYGFFLARHGSTADVAAATCVILGVDSSAVTAAPAHGHIVRDRTLASAYALRRWIQTAAPATRQLDIVSQGVHARRTHMIFSRVLGDSIRVGIIAVPDTRFGSGDWWQSSAGVKDVLGEVIGYVYAAIGRDQPAEE